ncbi:MAG: hypothetical protein ACI4EW_01295 [Butyrivibrio sp.]
MKKKIFIIVGPVVLLLLVAITLFIIFHNKNNKRSEGDYYSVAVDFIDTFSDEGYLVINEAGLLEFYDAQSGEHAVVCSEPNCKHDPSDTGCAAYLDGKLSAKLIDDEHIYIIGEFEGDRKLDCGYIYRQNRDGTDREIVAEFEDVQFVTQAELRGNYIVFQYWNYLDYSDYMNPVKTDSTLGIGIYNISTGKYMQKDLICYKNATSYCMGIYEDNVYISLTYWEDIEGDINNSLYSISLDTMDMKEIYTFEGDSYHWMCGKYFIWYFDDLTGTHILDVETGEIYEISDYTASDVFLYEEDIIFTKYNKSSDDLTLYRYDINNQKVYELFTYDEYNIYAYCNENLWLKKYVEGSHSRICVISKEDFVNGDLNKIKEIFAYEED